MQLSKMAKENYDYWTLTFWILLAVAVAVLVLGIRLDFSLFHWKVISWISFLLLIMGAVSVRKLAYVALRRMEVLQKLESFDPNVPQNLIELWSAHLQKKTLYDVLKKDYERAKTTHLATLNILEHTIDKLNKPKNNE